VKRKLPPEAFDFYVGMGIGRSYQAVADQYDASKGAVTALAKRDDWQDRLAKIEHEARHKADEKAVETLEQVNERHLKIARALQGKALEGLRSMSLQEAKDVIRALDLGVKQERLILGEPSERNAVSVEDKIEREYERWLESSPATNGRG
jgi:formate dehydrogenase maturation protein FdhE